MSSLSLKHIYKVYDGNVKAVNDFCMEIEDKEFIVFVGPSGCGKSTTLRMIAGLEEITAGELRIDDEIVNDYEPKDRNIAMVFQNYALYPHMTVYDNMAFSLKIAHLSKEEIKKKVLEAAEILDITEYLDRKPKALSGGQRQRVALGRAIVRNPKVFLLDEPLSNLDAKLRSAMRAEITRLHNRLQTTFIYVTHDQVEAMTMGTRIVVMKAGYVQQIDTPQNLYKYPGNMFVAGFIGTPQMNFFDGTISKVDNTVTFNLDCGIDIAMDYSLANKILVKYMNGQHKAVVGIRPDDIHLYDETLDEKEWQKAQMLVGVVEALGGETLIHGNFNKDNDVDKKGNVVIKVGGDCNVKTGDVIDVAINKRNIHVFDKETEVSIKTRVPKENIIQANVQGGELHFAGQSLPLASAILNQTLDGECSLTIPSNAIRLKEGSVNATIVAKEIIGKKALYELNVGGTTLFALSDNLAFELGATTLDIDMTRIAIEGERSVSALDTHNELCGCFIKLKEKSATGKKINNFYIKIGEQKLLAPIEIGEKLIACKGSKIFKTALSYEFDTDAVSIASEDENNATLSAEVAKVLDYGEHKFARLSVEGGEITVPIDCELSVGDKVSISLDYSKLTIKDSSLGIILL